MKTISINNYYSIVHLESAKNQQIFMHSIMSSIFTGLLAIAKNLLFAHSGQIKNLHTTAPLSSTPSLIELEKSYQEKSISTRIKEDLYVKPYKPITIPFTPFKNTQTTYNIMNPFNLFTKNKRIL